MFQKNKMSVFILTFLMTMLTSCSFRINQGQCNCVSDSKILLPNTLEGDGIPSDLTCIMSGSMTLKVLITEITSLYNELHNSQVYLLERSEKWEDIADEINDWLGTEHHGSCGNLFEEYNFTYSELGEKVNIKIKVIRVDWNRENGPSNNAPYVNQAYVRYQVSVSDRNENHRESDKAVSNLVISTCHQFVKNQE